MAMPNNANERAMKPCAVSVSSKRSAIPWGRKATRRNGCDACRRNTSNANEIGDRFTKIDAGNDAKPQMAPDVTIVFQQPFFQSRINGINANIDRCGLIISNERQIPAAMCLFFSRQSAKMKRMHPKRMPKLPILMHVDIW